MVLNGSIKGTWFLAYVEQELSPALLAGDIVVVDNLGCHRSFSIQQVIEARRARLVYLPKHFPDLNSIKMAPAKLKALPRKVDERSTEALWDRIAQLLHAFTPQECANYFKAAGSRLA